MPIRATPRPVRSRRHPVRAVEQARPASRQSSVTAKLLLLANSRAARTAFVVVGAAGLTALAVALIGPRRLEKEVIRPLRGALEPQAEKLWAEAKPLREQIVGLFQNATPTGREKLVRKFQSWIGHFRAT